FALEVTEADLRGAALDDVADLAELFRLHRTPCQRLRRATCGGRGGGGPPTDPRAPRPVRPSAGRAEARGGAKDPSRPRAARASTTRPQPLDRQVAVGRTWRTTAEAAARDPRAGVGITRTKCGGYAFTDRSIYILHGRGA